MPLFILFLIFRIFSRETFLFSFHPNQKRDSLGMMTSSVEDVMTALGPVRTRLEELRSQRRGASTRASSQASSRPVTPVKEGGVQRSIDEPDAAVNLLVQLLSVRQAELFAWSTVQLCLLQDMLTEDYRTPAGYSWNEDKTHMETTLTSLKQENEALRQSNRQLSSQLADANSKLSASEVLLHDKQAKWTSWTLELERAAAVIAKLDEEKKHLVAVLAQNEVHENHMAQRVTQLMLTQQDREQQVIVSCKDAETSSVNRVLAEATEMREHYRGKVQRLKERNAVQEQKIRSLTELLASNASGIRRKGN